MDAENVQCIAMALGWIHPHTSYFNLKMLRLAHSYDKIWQAYNEDIDTSTLQPVRDRSRSAV